MIYLSSFTFPSMETQEGFIIAEKHTCYDSFYPFKVLDAGRLEFEPITILYGNNGSGKTTALNVMAEALKLKRDSLYNRSNFFEDYISEPVIKLDKSYSEIKFINCTGKLDGDTVYLSKIQPYEFAAFEVK